MVRSSGTGALEDIAAVVLETNGTYSWRRHVGQAGTQVGPTGSAKLELGKNYWDEMRLRPGAAAARVSRV